MDVSLFTLVLFLAYFTLLSFFLLKRKQNKVNKVEIKYREKKKVNNKVTTTVLAIHTEKTIFPFPFTVNGI